MWTIIALLWLIPLAAGLVLLARVVRGRPAFSAEEWRLFFGDSKEKPLSSQLWLKFGVLGIVFFIVGVFEGLVLINIGFVWLTAPLVTGLGAILAGLALASNETKESLWLAKNNARLHGRILRKLSRPQTANRH